MNIFSFVAISDFAVNLASTVGSTVGHLSFKEKGGFPTVLFPPPRSNAPGKLPESVVNNMLLLCSRDTQKVLDILTPPRNDTQRLQSCAHLLRSEPC